jgi:hypothetical protein
MKANPNRLFLWPAMDRWLAKLGPGHPRLEISSHITIQPSLQCGLGSDELRIDDFPTVNGHLTRMRQGHLEQMGPIPRTQITRHFGFEDQVFFYQAKTDLLEGFPHRRLSTGLASLDQTSGYRPASSVGAFDQQNFFPMPDGHHGATNTRFGHCKDNARRLKGHEKTGAPQAGHYITQNGNPFFG